ncbi:hypothetical protein M405DRAFT_840405 [Rhizopogon salebrosus TDB-379]|nr:hypothetical protein M405DRAFT_840405 [Rhizopogon salebrosus TDB-379]
MSCLTTVVVVIPGLPVFAGNIKNYNALKTIMAAIAHASFVCTTRVESILHNVLFSTTELSTSQMKANSGVSFYERRSPLSSKTIQIPAREDNPYAIEGDDFNNINAEDDGIVVDDKKAISDVQLARMSSEYLCWLGVKMVQIKFI